MVVYVCGGGEVMVVHICGVVGGLMVVGGRGVLMVVV